MNPSSKPTTDLNIEFPRGADRLDQDQEWFSFAHNGERRRLRLHDYAEIFSVPGLYEALIYEKLECDSPSRVADLLATVLVDWPRSPTDLRVLDLGAGNGIAGEALRSHEVSHIVGLDLLPEAAEAAQRDRPEIYADYLVANLCHLTKEEAVRLESHRFNCLVTVAALGFGDIPPTAFAEAFGFVCHNGWVAMTIKEDFLDASRDDSGFSRFIRSLLRCGILSVQAHHRFCHRRSLTGDQLFYVALVARKTAEIPAQLVEDPDGFQPDGGSGGSVPELLLSTSR